MHKPVSILLGLILGLCLSAGAGRLHADEASLVGGTVQVELADKSVVKGTLLDLSDDVVSLRTKDGDFRYERKNVKSIQPIAAAPAKPADIVKPKRSVKDAAEEADARDEDIAPRAKKITPPNAPKDAAMEALTKKKDQAPPPMLRKVNQGQIVVDPDAPKNYVQALRMLDARNFKGAAQALRELVTKSAIDEVAKAESLCRDTFSLSLPEMIVRCYMNDLCAACKGEGIIPCQTCTGTGYNAGPMPRTVVQPGVRTINPNNQATVKDPAQHNRDPRHVSICARCRGYGYDPCQTCGGTRVTFPDPTAFEREAYAMRLMTLASECLNKSEIGYGESIREALLPQFFPRGNARMKPMTEQIWLRDSISAVKSDIMRMWRAETFYSKAVEIDPIVTLRSNKDLQQEITKIRTRRLHLTGELSERLQVYAQNRVEHALDELHYSETFAGDGRPEKAKFSEIISDE